MCSCRVGFQVGKPILKGHETFILCYQPGAHSLPREPRRSGGAEIPFIEYGTPKPPTFLKVGVESFQVVILFNPLVPSKGKPNRFLTQLLKP